MQKIGFIGLGRMGRPMAINLVKKGFSVTVFDIHPTGVDAAIAAGATRAATVKQAIEGADILITMLPSSIEVEQVTCECMQRTALLVH